MSQSQMGRFKPSPTTSNTDNMRAFSTGEEEVFLKICKNRVFQIQLGRLEDKDNMDLDILFISSDWDKVAAEMPKSFLAPRRTSSEMQTHYRQNKDDITTFLKKQFKRCASLPTQPSSSKGPSQGKKRRHTDSDADADSTVSPNKRQTTEETSPKAQKTNQPASLPPKALTPVNNEGAAKSETSTSGPNSPLSRSTGTNSSQQPSAGDSTPQSQHSSTGQPPECDVEVNSENAAAIKAKYEGQIALLQLQLSRQNDQFKKELAAAKDRNQVLKKENDELRRANEEKFPHDKELNQKLKKENDELRRANLGLEWDRTNLEEKVDQHKKNYKEKVAELTEKAAEEAAELKAEIDRSYKKFCALDGKFSDQRIAWERNADFYEVEKKDMQRQLDELRKVDSRHRAERDQLRKRAGLDSLGNPKPKHTLATYGPGDNGLHSQNSVNHACEKYFIQMLLTHYDTRKEKQQKFLKTATTIFKNHGVPLPAYLGGETKETKKSGT